jgi:hypothetical protein
VDASARESVEGSRHDGGERLALTRLHLDDVAAIERNRGDDLDIEGSQAQNAAGCVAHEREDGRSQVCQVGAGADLIAKPGGAFLELSIGEGRYSAA